MNKKAFYTTKNVLQKIKISRNTLFLWLKKGKIPEVTRDRNGYRLFTQKDIQNILRYKNKKNYPNSRQL